jgi:hypothetical protein
MEHDPEGFSNIVEWVNGLALQAAPRMGHGTRLLSKVLGYERTLRLRGAFRRYRQTASRVRLTHVVSRLAPGMPRTPEPR